VTRVYLGTAISHGAEAGEVLEVLVTLYPDAEPDDMAAGEVALRSRDRWRRWGPPGTLTELIELDDCGYCHNSPDDGKTCPECGRSTP
jgi:hypothetical protein